MRGLLEHLIILVIFVQGYACTKHSWSNSRMDAELTKTACTSLFTASLIQRAFGPDIARVFRDVDVSEVLDNPVAEMQKNVNTLKEILPERTGSYADLAQQTLDAVAKTKGNLQPELAVLGSVYVQSINTVARKFGTEQLSSFLALADVPGFKEHLQRLYTITDRRLNSLCAENYNQGVILRMRDINEKFNGTVNNVPSMIKLLAFYKYFIMNRILTPKGFNEFYGLLNNLNVGNIYKDAIKKIDGHINDLCVLKVDSIVELSRNISNQLKTKEMKGLASTLIGGGFNLVLIFIKDVLRRISPKELKNVVKEMNKFNSACAATDLEWKLQTYEDSIKRSGHEGFKLGVIVLFHIMTRFVMEPWKSALKSGLLVLTVCVDAVLKNVEVQTLVQFFGTSKTDYRMLAAADLVSGILGAPTGS